MVDITFTKAELESLTVSQLQILADYYELKYTKRMKKDELVELMAEYYGISEEEITPAGVERPQMSVRIRRIKEASRGN